MRWSEGKNKQAIALFVKWEIFYRRQCRDKNSERIKHMWDS